MQRSATARRQLRQRSGPFQDLEDKCVCNQRRAEINNLNLEKDLEDTQSTAWRVGSFVEEKTTKLWKQLEGDEQ